MALFVVVRSMMGVDSMVWRVVFNEVVVSANVMLYKVRVEMIVADRL